MVSRACDEQSSEISYLADALLRRLRLWDEDDDDDDDDVGEEEVVSSSS